MLFFHTLWLLIVVLPFVCIECLGNYEYCDKGWYKYRDSCFSINDERLSFYDAEDHCRSQGAHLASIHSKDESIFLQNLVDELRYGRSRRWIGLNILEGKHQWSDDTVVDFLDFYNKTQYKLEKCYILYSRGSFRPEHCELRYGSICKKSVEDVTPSPIPPITPVVPEGNCPHDWQQFGQKCYKFFGAEEEDRKKFKEAKLACLALGENHDLVSIHSMPEQAFLTEKMGDFGSSVWIGLSQVESDEIGQILVFGWTDNTRVNFTYWAPSHPQRGTWKNCVRLGYEGVAKGEWIGDYCEIHKRGYVCERPPVPNLPPKPSKISSCKGNSSEYRDSCYNFHPTPKTWNEAEKICQQSGSHLVSVRDSFEEAFLFNYLHGKATNVWNGLKTFENTRMFQWSDNEPLYYSKWKTFPQTSAKRPSCTFMRASGDLNWNTTTCDAKLPFVCKSSPKRPPGRHAIIGDCPAGESSWTDIGDDYCYHAGHSGSRTTQWGSLSRYCITKGMEMVTLKSDHQVNSLMPYLSHASYNFWLGLVRSFDRKSFIWVDHSPVNYTNWADREPSSWSSDKDCVAFSTRDSKWFVQDCNAWAGILCRGKKIVRNQI